MKLVVIFCLSVVFYVDSVSGLTFNEALSYIPGWDAIVATWEHIKEAIKRPVKVKRWERAKQQMSRTSPKTSATAETTTTSNPPILQSNKMETRFNATREKTTQLKIISPIRNLTTKTFNISSVLTPRKTIVPLILPSSENRPFTFAEPLLSSVLLPTTSTKSSISANSSVYTKSKLTVRSTNRSTTSTMDDPTSYIPPTTSTLTIMTTSAPDTVTKRTVSYAVKPIFETDQADVTPAADFSTITAPNEARVNVPYISSPVFRSAEDWRRLQSMPFASALSVNEVDNDPTVSMVADETHRKKGLSDTKKYSFGSLFFI